MTDLERAQNRARITRLLELPGLLDVIGRKIVAQRAELRKVERRIAFREAELKLDLIDDKRYTNADARSAALVVACGNDDELAKHYDRFDSLKTAIERFTHERDVLDHERKALKAALEREYAEIIEQVQTDRMLAAAVARGGRA